MPKYNNSPISIKLISVIIPTLNEEKNIKSTLEAARRSYSDAEIEIILVDGGSTDSTLEKIPKDVSLVQTLPNRALQMNQGAQISHGEILLFCHGDTQLPPAWREAVLKALNDPQISGGAFQSRLEPEIGILKWVNQLKLPPDWHLMYGDQCLFVRRAVFEHIQGYPEIPLMEDVELARRMAQQGKLARINLRVLTDSRRMLENGILKQLLGNIWRMSRYLYLGASPQDLANTYRSSREKLK